MTTTPLMQMVLPEVGATFGPEWAAMLIQALQDRLDSHDHTAGNGAKVRAAGLNIDGSVDMKFMSMINLLFSGYHNNTVFQTALGNLQVYNGDLWLRNHAGQNIQITSGGSLAVPGSGAITSKVLASFPYTVLAGDAQRVLLVDSSTGAKTINLLSAGTASMWFGVKDTGGQASVNPITINVNTPATERIDGETSHIIDSDYGAIFLVNDAGSTWSIN